jgi:Leucine-rich repeat (LRR) protein
MAPSGGSCCPIKFSLTVTFSVLLFLVPSDRLCVSGQWDCPDSAGFYSCVLDDSTYIIFGGTDDSTNSFDNIPPLDMTSFPGSSMRTVYRSYELDPNVSVTNVQASAFNGLRVNELRLDGHGIQTVDPSAFSGISSELNQLILDNNNITLLPVTIFRPLTSVQLVSLSGNRLISLETGIFDSTQTAQLRWVRLSDNQLTSVPDMLFASLTSLVGLWLDGNNLTSISSGLLRGLTSLMWLDLSGNAIVSINSTAFADLSSLERLQLQDNRLVTLDVGLFVPSPSIELLDVSKNSLTSLPISDLQHFSSSKIIYIGLAGKSLLNQLFA